MHRLLSFLLPTSRSQGIVWVNMSDTFTAEVMYEQMSVMLTAPIYHLKAFSSWSAAHIMAELSALPTEYITLLCCVMLEQQEQLSRPLAQAKTDPRVRGAGASRKPNTARPQPIQSYSRLHTLQLHIGNNIGLIGNEILKLLVPVQHLEDGRVYHLLTTTSVMQLHKQIVLMHLSQPALALSLEHASTIPILVNLLSRAASFKQDAARHGSLQVYLEKLDGGGTQHLPNLRPSVHFSDIALLRQTFVQASREAGMEQRTNLIANLLRSWRENTPPTAAEEGPPCTCS
ncbi:MAG: hypothetical protein WDW38_003679 [Sanguina aurantia]